MLYQRVRNGYCSLSKAAFTPQAPYIYNFSFFKRRKLVLVLLTRREREDQLGVGDIYIRLIRFGLTVGPGLRVVEMEDGRYQLSNHRSGYPRYKRVTKNAMGKL